MIAYVIQVKTIFSAHELYSFYDLYKFDIHMMETRYEGWKHGFMNYIYTYEGLNAYTKALL
jgi:hypothetical protein